MQISWKKTWLLLRKYLLNKYIITCLIFAIILTFCGEQSLINRIEHERRIKQMEKELRQTKQEIEQYKTDLQELQQNPENIERYAREHYYMHTDKEDIYIIQ